MKRGRLVSNLILVLMGVIFCGSSLAIGIGTINAPDSGFFPFVTGGILVFFSLGAILEEYSWKKTRNAEQLVIPKQWRAVLSVLLSLVVYVLILDSIGFLLSTFLVMTFEFKVPKHTSWKIALGGGVATTLSAYFLFEYLLKCGLPRGFLGV